MSSPAEPTPLAREAFPRGGGGGERRRSLRCRDEGKSLVVTRREGTLTGHCRFIPGSFVLRSSDDGGFALRARASAQARRLLPIPVGTAVWQRPDRRLKGDWFPVSTFVARARSLSAVDGWLRQRKPLVSH